MSEQVRIASTTESAEDLLKSAGPGAELTEGSEDQGANQEQRQPEQQQDAQQQRDGRQKSSYQKRVDSLVKQRSQEQERARIAEERARIAEEKLRQYEAPGAAEQSNGNGAQPPALLAEQPAPTETDRRTVERFQQAWNQMHQRLNADPQKKAALRAVVDKAVENGITEIPEPARVAAIHQPNAEDIFTYVLDNTEVLEKLSRMHPQRQFEAIHRISLDLDLNSQREMQSQQPAARAMTRTPPPPINPVGNSGARGSITSADVDSLDYQQYKRARDSGRIGMSATERAKRGIA